MAYGPHSSISQFDYEDIVKKANNAILEMYKTKYEKPSIDATLLKHTPKSLEVKEIALGEAQPVSIGIDWAKHLNKVAFDYVAPMGNPSKVHLDAKPQKELVVNLYTTGTGQVLKWVHDETPDCEALGCVIHNPTDPHQDWPTHWEAGVMWRKCPCGELHPDLNHCNFMERTFGSDHRTHECECKCCEGPKVEGHAADLLKAMGLSV